MGKKLNIRGKKTTKVFNKAENKNRLCQSKCKGSLWITACYQSIGHIFFPLLGLQPGCCHPSWKSLLDVVFTVCFTCVLLGLEVWLLTQSVKAVWSSSTRCLYFIPLCCSTVEWLGLILIRSQCLYNLQRNNLYLLCPQARDRCVRLCSRVFPCRSASIYNTLTST